MQLSRFHIFEPYKDMFIHALSDRHGGVSEGAYLSLNLGLATGDSPENISENYNLFSKKAGFDLGKLCIAHQDHTDKVPVVTEGAGLLSPFTGVDGFMTATPGIPLMVRFADCQGVLFFDPVRKAIAAVHSGWRGNAQDILKKTIAQMKKEFSCDPANILVGIGPSLGPCCAEFTDPHSELPEKMHKYIDGKKVDLWADSTDQLLDSGILLENIEVTGICTLCENNTYFSFRGSKGITGHMGAVIQLL